MTTNHQKLVWQESGTLRRVPCPELHVGAEFKGVWQYFVQMLIKSCREHDYFILNFSFLYRCLVPGPHTVCLTLHISEPQGFSFPDLANAHSCSPVKASVGSSFSHWISLPELCPLPLGLILPHFVSARARPLKACLEVLEQWDSPTTLKQHLMDISEEE